MRLCLLLMTCSHPSSGCCRVKQNSQQMLAPGSGLLIFSDVTALHFEGTEHKSNGAIGLAILASA